MAAPQTIADTLFYGSGANVAAIAVDQSQYADSHTAGASWSYDTTATRYDLTEWSIDVDFDATTGTTGRMYTYGSGAGNGRTISLRIGNVAGQIDAIANPGGVGTVLGSLALPGASGSSQRFLVSWTCEANPLTTGASDAVVHTLHAWNLATGAYDRASFTAATRTAGSGTAVLWALDSAGSNAFTGTPRAGRVSSACHTATETYEEMGTASSAPTLVGEERTEIAVPARSSGLGDDGQFAGPIHALAAAAVRRNDLRLVGPLTNQVTRSRLTHRGDRVGDEPFTIEDPEQAGRYLYLCTLDYGPVSPAANRLAVRVFLQQWRTTGDADTLEITAYSLSQPGWAYRPPTSPVSMVVHRQSTTRLASDGSGATAGTWITFDPLRIARDLDGATYVGLGFRVTSPGGSGSTADQLWTVKALIADQCFVDDEDGLPGLGG